MTTLAPLKKAGMKKEDLNLRSEEIQELMEKPPSWIIRWGITTIFGIILLSLLLSWLIKYPEIISGPTRLTTSIPPIKVISQSNGNLTHLYVKDGESVKEGQILAQIENPLSIESIQYLNAYLVKLEKAVSQKQNTLPLAEKQNMILGDLQNVFNDLQREINTFNLNRYYKIDEAKIVEIQQNIKNQQELLVINRNMINIAKKELENAALKLESDRLLYKNNVLTRQEFYLKQTEFNTKQLQLEQLEQTKVQYEVSLNTLNMQLSQGVYDKNSRSLSTLESIRSGIKSLHSYLYGWQQKYSLVALTDGTISYMKNLQVNQFIKAGEETFALFQPGDSVIALAEIPVAGFGKVRTGQDVHILLDNFPHYDHGMLEGKVRKIALLPNSNFYRVEISLPKGMNSTQGQNLKFTPEMIGLAEVITDDKTVMERIFKSIVKLFQPG